ncbi:hypothetical protein AAFF_G00247660 [Aldrovandia affinis]|uniref:Uncharacterized protein n=1 Tax=Aldrovandia affinis TaxID=143900 RepID=A0AAD7W3L7_9TELE|nr:hypothetical protein AAFF_G00247660 [Aldrovandia affinis]
MGGFLPLPVWGEFEEETLLISYISPGLSFSRNLQEREDIMPHSRLLRQFSHRFSRFTPVPSPSPRSTLLPAVIEAINRHCFQPLPPPLFFGSVRRVIAIASSADSLRFIAPLIHCCPLAPRHPSPALFPSVFIPPSPPVCASEPLTLVSRAAYPEPSRLVQDTKSLSLSWLHHPRGAAPPIAFSLSPRGSCD